MQSLPEIPPAGRKAAAECYLERAGADFLPAEQAEITQQVLAILNDLIFAELFTPGSRGEVPIVGRLARPGGIPIAVSGQVDRLAVTPDSVLIADYKTDSALPRSLAQTPDAYVAQLALYRAVIARIYPDKTIRAALIFTGGPVVIELPAAVLDAALAETLARVTPR
jgi:ATP-dependent helicase/nuclease subunit A